MSQAELAEASGVTQSNISVIEGGRTTLGAERAERMAEALQGAPRGAPGA